MGTAREGYKLAELGQIPSEWGVMPIEEIAELFIDGDWIESKDMSVEGIRLIQTGNIGVGTFIEKEKMKFISEETFESKGCNEVLEGDILICRLASPIGRACVVRSLKYKSIVAVDIAILRLKENLNDEFINYYLNSEINLERVATYTSGSTRQRISRGNLAKVTVPIPSLEEQQKIASILTTVDEQIDETEQMIEKTKELKKGLMQQLLTKGIGHTEFKQTELGEIPVEWEIKQLSEIANIRGGKRLPKGVELVEENTGYPYLRIIDMGKGNILFNNVKFVPTEIAPLIKEYKIFEGEIYITVAGALLGLVGMIPKEIDGINLTENADRICDISINNYYLEHYLKGDYIQNQISNVKTVNAQPKLSLQQIRQFNILVPPINEQQKIAQILSTVNEQIVVYEQEKAKYEELKKGLIQQLLTGQIRVKI